MARRELDALFLVGQRLSNIAFSLSQSDKLDARDRQTLREDCAQWDNALRAYRVATKPKSRAKRSSK